MSTIMPEHTPDQLRFQIEHMVEMLVGSVRHAKREAEFANTQLRITHDREGRDRWHQERDYWHTYEAVMRELAYRMRVGVEFEDMLTECEYHDRQQEQEGV
jgi:hypothetical protein